MTSDRHPLTIRQLFENRVVLRDLRPTDESLPGIEELRGELGLPERAIPRKNEHDYARVLQSIVRQATRGRAKSILYVGDTILHDGSVVRHLCELGKLNAVGFIGNEVPSSRVGDFVIHRLVFSDRWRGLKKLPAIAADFGITLGPECVAVFDLDQTVYAARSRNTEPLRRARFDAVGEILAEALGQARYDAERLLRLYREFDREEYHAITGDNQDSVVFLTLVCALGLYDPVDIRRYFEKPQSSIADLIASSRGRLQARRQSEDLDAVCEIMDEIYFDSRAGDITPFKRFRYREYRKTVEAMRSPSPGTPNGTSSHIRMTHEIVDFVDYLRGFECLVFAFSDRPPEATAPAETAEGPSLLDIPMDLSDAPEYTADT